VWVGTVLIGPGTWGTPTRVDGRLVKQSAKSACRRRQEAKPDLAALPEVEDRTQRIAKNFE
jgi:hypothetical protein